MTRSEATTRTGRTTEPSRGPSRCASRATPHAPHSTLYAPRSSAHARHRGLSLVEVLLALAITAMLLTATMLAVDASFKAYADAAEQASTQAASRMVTQRLLTLIRTSTAHGPLEGEAGGTVNIKDPDDPDVTHTVVIASASRSDDTVTSPWLELIDSKGVHVKVAHLSYTNVQGELRQELWLITNPGQPGEQSQPLLSGVTSAVFACKRRKDTQGVWVLERGTMDLTVQPGVDRTLSLEYGQPTPIRIIGSTMPRKLD